MFLVKDPDASRLFKTDIYMHYDKKLRPVRRYVKTEDGTAYSFSRWLWDNKYPHDRLRRGEEIHHKDFDALNDRIENYEKMTKEEHIELHRRFHKYFLAQSVKVRLRDMEALRRLQAALSIRRKGKHSETYKTNLR